MIQCELLQSSDFKPPTADLPPLPPSSAEIVEVLSAMAEDAAFLAHCEASNLYIGWQIVDISLPHKPINQRVWRLWFWLDFRWWDSCDHIRRIDMALSPDGRLWEYGCERWPSWHDGPSATIADPWEQLNNNQRSAIYKRLSNCQCWPIVETDIDVLPIEEIWTAEQLEAIGGG